MRTDFRRSASCELLVRHAEAGAWTASLPVRESVTVCRFGIGYSQDRFHLIQNLQEAMQLELTCQRAHLTIPAEDFAPPSETKEASVGGVAISRPRRARRNTSQDEVRQLEIVEIRRWLECCAHF